MSWEGRKIFSPGSMVLFGKARKISSYFVKAKIYPLERSAGSKQLMSKKTFSSTVTSENFTINHELNCGGVLSIC